MTMKLLSDLTDFELDKHIEKLLESNVAQKYMKRPLEELARRQEEKRSKKKG